MDFLPPHAEFAGAPEIAPDGGPFGPRGPQGVRGPQGPQGPPGRDGTNGTNGTGIDTAAWTTYTPTWTGSVSNPDIGNGTLEGAYLLAGKVLFFRLHMVAGGTTTFGSGSWTFGLPGGIVALTGGRQTMIAMAQDIGTAMNAGLCFLSSGATSFQIGAVVGGSLWGNVAPHSWANTDILRVNGVIEID